jgi:hypothetical protein
VIIRRSHVSEFEIEVGNQRHDAGPEARARAARRGVLTRAAALGRRPCGARAHGDAMSAFVNLVFDGVVSLVFLAPGNAQVVPAPATGSRGARRRSGSLGRGGRRNRRAIPARRVRTGSAPRSGRLAVLACGSAGDRRASGILRSKSAKLGPRGSRNLSAIESRQAQHFCQFEGVAIE